MSHRLYALVTRSAALLILALLVAPLWDSWRYRGLAPSGGAAFPVGAIMSAPRRAPDVSATQAVAAAGRPAIANGLAENRKLAALQSPVHGWAPPSPPSHQSAATSAGSVFEAWSARAQVDPFWNGETAAQPPDGLSADEGDGVGLDGIDDPAAEPRDPRAAAGAAGATPDQVTAKRRAAAEDDRPDDGESPEGPARVDEPKGPIETRVMAGLWPLLPAAPENPPAPTPEPADSGAASSSRVYSPHPSPGDPKPAPVAVPLVTAQVATPEVASGDVVLVAIRIENADRMTSLPFHLDFDPTIIEFAGSQAGSALATHDPILLASVSPNRPGDLAVGLSLIETAGAFTGSGEVVTLQFRALAPGRSDLSFSRATLRGARSESVEVRFANGHVTVR
jgi:hypothetical protein